MVTRHSRKPRKNKYLKKPGDDNLAKVRRCFAAYERFVMLGAIALGLLQLIALKYESLVWKEFQGFLRTKSRSLPSGGQLNLLSVICSLRIYSVSLPA